MAVTVAQAQEPRRRRVGRRGRRRDDGGAEPVDRRGHRRRCRAARRQTSSGRSTLRGDAWDEWRNKTPKDRMELLLKLADVIEENGDELWQLESLNVGKPMAIARDEIPFSVDNLRFFAGAARNLEGKSAAEYVEGYTSIIRREPLGIVAGITPVELPADDGGLEARPGARRRQRPDPQARRADAADDAPLLRARAGRRAARRRPGGHRRRCARGRRARPASRDPARVADRRRRDGQDRSPATPPTT